MKKNEKEKIAAQEVQKSSWKEILNFYKNDGVRVFLGFAIFLFAVFMVVGFTSYFFHGASDQSVVENATSAELASVDNGIENDGGSLGAQLSHYFINNLFGIPSYFIAVFLFALALKLMHVHKIRLWKWFILCMMLMYWSSIALSFLFQHIFSDSFFYLGGLHGYNVSRWLESQVGATGVFLLLLLAAVCFLIYFSS